MKQEGKLRGSWLCNNGGVDWKGLADSGKIVFMGEGADVGLLGWVGNKGVLEWGNVPEEVPMDTGEKSRLKLMRFVLRWKTGFLNMSYKCN